MPLDEELATRAYAADPAAWSLGPELSNFLLEWRRTIDQYWGLSAGSCPDGLRFDQWERLKQWAATANQLLPIAQSLSIPGSDHGKELMSLLRESLSAQLQNPVVRQLIELEAMALFAKQFKGSADRLSLLLSVVQPTPRSPKAAEYLKRVADLYLAGFEPEISVSARATMEHALKESVAVTGQEPKWQLDDLIKQAGGLGLLPGRNPLPKRSAQPGTPYWHADRLKLTGNHVAHKAPSYPTLDDGLPSPVAVLKSLSIVLDSLYAA